MVLCGSLIVPEGSWRFLLFLCGSLWFLVVFCCGSYWFFESLVVLGCSWCFLLVLDDLWRTDRQTEILVVEFKEHQVFHIFYSAIVDTDYDNEAMVEELFLIPAMSPPYSSHFLMIYSMTMVVGSGLGRGQGFLVEDFLDLPYQCLSHTRLSKNRSVMP